MDVERNSRMTMVSLTVCLGRDFEIDLGGRTRYSSEQDSAEDPLFSWLSDELKERKTYSTFMKLMDNYSYGFHLEKSLTPPLVIMALVNDKNSAPGNPY